MAFDARSQAVLARAARRKAYWAASISARDYPELAQRCWSARPRPRPATISSVMPQHCMRRVMS